MEKIDISFFAIVKIFSFGIFSYVIAPLLFTLRDAVLLWSIDRFVLTDKLRVWIDVFELDRWKLENIYNKSLSIGVPVLGGGSRYKIDGEEVSKDFYDDYERRMNFHKNRFFTLDSKIVSRNNLVFWLTKHYKQEGFESPIPKWREHSYNINRAIDNRGFSKGGE